MGKYTQSNPPARRYHLPAWGKPRSFTTTEEAYDNKAIEQSGILIENMRLQGYAYQWGAVVRAPRLETGEYKRQWKCIHNKMLRRGLVSLHTREENGDGESLHHHFVFKGRHREDALRLALGECLLPGWRLDGLSLLKSPLKWCQYIFKAGRWAPLRQVFQKKVGFHKAGTIGDFWEVPKAQLLARVKARQKAFKATIQAHDDAHAYLAASFQDNAPETLYNVQDCLPIFEPVNAPETVTIGGNSFSVSAPWQPLRHFNQRGPPAFYPVFWPVAAYIRYARSL